MDPNYQNFTPGQLIEEIKKNRFVDLELEKKLCLLLLEKDPDNDFSVATAYVYLCDYYLSTNENIKGLHYINQANQLLTGYPVRNEDTIYLSTLIYHFYGMFYACMFDEQKSIEYYLKGLELAEQHNNIAAQSSFYNNIADCFENFSNYEKAATYYLQSAQLFFDDPTSSPLARIVSLCNMANSYYFCKKPQYIPILVNELAKIEIPNQTCLFLYHYVFTLKALTDNNQEELSMACDELFSIHKTVQDRLLVQQLIVYVTQFLIEAKNQKLAKQSIEILSEIDRKNAARLYKQYLKLKILFSQTFQINEGIDAVYREYYETINQIEYHDNQSRSAGLQAKIELFEAKRQQKNILEQNRLLHNLTNTDPLTQCMNRRFFDQNLKQIHSINLTSIGVAILDIDFFKEYNDQYGHAEGDQILIRVASILTKYRSPFVIPCRYGGDEFGVLFYNQTEKAVQFYFENVFNDIRQAKIEHIAKLGYVTLSAGYCFEDYRPDLDIRSLLKQADKALYLSKRRGRNTYTKYEKE